MNMDLSNFIKYCLGYIKLTRQRHFLAQKKYSVELAEKYLDLVTILSAADESQQLINLEVFYEFDPKKVPEEHRQQYEEEKAIALKIEDIYSKHMNDQFTKQISLSFGYFEIEVPLEIDGNGEEEEEQVNGQMEMFVAKKIDRYPLFSLGVKIEKDQAGRYFLAAVDEEVQTNLSVRGLLHGPHRPQLIICDDVEDMESARTREGREKTRQWVMGELLPTGTSQTRAIFIGNLLHRDALIPRLKRDIESGAITGIYRQYPLLDEQKRCLWPGKYPTPESIDAQFKRIGGDHVAWHREFLLEFIDEGGRLISPDWIRYYDEQPPDGKLVDIVISIDLALKLTASADYTAMVAAKVYEENGKRVIYIQPNPINKRLTHLETIETTKHLFDVLKGKRTPKIFVEDVGYQGALVETLNDAGYRAEGFKVRNQDKRTRLALGTHLIQSGQVLFPRQGCEELITQLLDFGIEPHEDLADALSMLLLSIRMRSMGSYYGESF